MASLSTLLPRLFRLLFGDPGPADMVVTRSADAVHFRLRNRRCGWRAYVLILAAAALGAVVLALLFGTPFLATFFVAAYLAWRFTWHYEITLNEKHLRVDSISSWRRRTHCYIALAHVGQLTVVQGARSAWLQAESSNDEVEPILDDGAAELLERLARHLSECHAELTNCRPPIRVVWEAPLAQVRTERLQPPLNSRIVINRHPGGIMLDFPAPPMAEPEPASGQFRLIIVPCVLFGIAMSASAAGCGAVFLSKRGEDLPGVICETVLVCFPLFTLIAVICAVQRTELFKRSRNRAYCWPRRLVLTDTMLIRTLLAGGKEVWYRDEIERIEIEINRIGNRQLWLRLVTKVGEQADLLGGIEDRGVEDYRPRAELEWVATELQRALSVPAMPADAITATKPRDWHVEQIQDRSGYRRRS